VPKFAHRPVLVRRPERDRVGPRRDLHVRRRVRDDDHTLERARGRLLERHGVGGRLRQPNAHHRVRAPDEPLHTSCVHRGSDTPMGTESPTPIHIAPDPDGPPAMPRMIEWMLA